MTSSAQTEPVEPKLIETRKIAWDIIRIEPETQPRQGPLDEDTVERYTADKLRGDEFPPLRVFYDGKRYWLSDGHYRIAAHERALHEDPTVGLAILANIYQGTKRDAVLDSLAANRNHGRARTSEDLLAAIVKLHNDAEWGQWSDGKIATIVHASQPYVSRVRRKLEEKQAGVPPLIETDSNLVLSDDEGEGTTAPPPTPPRIRKTASGRTIDTTNIGKKKKPKVEPALTDIDVEDVDEVPIRTPTPARNGETKSGLALTWPEVGLVFNINVQPGKSLKRRVQIGARAGGPEVKPILRADFTLADFEPLPRIFSELLGPLSKSAARADQTRPNKTAAKSTKNAKKK